MASYKIYLHEKSFISIEAEDQEKAVDLACNLLEKEEAGLIRLDRVYLRSDIGRIEQLDGRAQYSQNDL